MRTSREQISQAVTLQNQGRIADAMAIYRLILKEDPGNSDALHLCGLALGRSGAPQQALSYLGAAVKIQPANAVMLTNLGNCLNELGKYSEAIAFLDRAVALKPELAAAYLSRGIAQLRLGRLDAAKKTMNDAVRLAPNDASAHSVHGVILEAMGRLDEALQSFRRSVALNPKNPEAHHNLGLVEFALNFKTEALASLDRALALQPSHAAAHYNRAMVLVSMNQLAQALEAFDRAIARAPPGRASTHLQRGKVCLQLKDVGEALKSFDNSLALDPKEFEAHFLRGVALGMLGKFAEALQSYSTAAEINPASAEVANNRGVALGSLFRTQEALDCFNEALVRNPRHVTALTNAANILKGLKHFDESAQYFERARAADPDDAAAAWGQALLKLTLGDFQEGWALHESRFGLTHMGSLKSVFDRPRWSGAEPLEGKTLLVHAEQGLGDTIQFCRYVRLLDARGARVILKVQTVLSTLLRSLGVSDMFDDTDARLPDFDYHCPLMSLPLAFGTDLDSIPGGVPYLHADPARTTAWRERLAVVPGIKVGLNWQGNPDTEKQPWVHGRSFSLKVAEALARVEGVTLISMQKGPGAEQRGQVPFGTSIMELQDPYDLGSDSMLETAALVSALDLVITSDTALAHLAGALGARVWTLLSASPDWRWLTDRLDSPWYPSMRLFRQRELGAWGDVFERVTSDLQSLVAERG